MQTKIISVKCSQIQGQPGLQLVGLQQPRTQLKPGTTTLAQQGQQTAGSKSGTMTSTG